MLADPAHRRHPLAIGVVTTSYEPCAMVRVHAGHCVSIAIGIKARFCCRKRSRIAAFPWTCPRCAGSGCCAARRAAVRGPASRPFGRPSLTQARRHPPRSLARRVSPDCGLPALPVRSPMQRSRLRLHRDAEQPRQPSQAGCACGRTTAARSRARGSRSWVHSRCA